MLSLIGWMHTWNQPCTRGIWVFFIKACLFLVYLKWSAWQIYHKYLFRWNQQMYFTCFCDFGAQAFSFKIYCGFNIEPNYLFVSEYQGCPQTLTGVCRNLWFFQGTGRKGENISGFYLIIHMVQPHCVVDILYTILLMMHIHFLERKMRILIQIPLTCVLWGTFDNNQH